MGETAETRKRGVRKTFGKEIGPGKCKKCAQKSTQRSTRRVNSGGREANFYKKSEETPYAEKCQCHRQRRNLVSRRNDFLLKRRKNRNQGAVYQGPAVGESREREDSGAKDIKNQNARGKKGESDRYIRKREKWAARKNWSNTSNFEDEWRFLWGNCRGKKVCGQRSRRENVRREKHMGFREKIVSKIIKRRAHSRNARKGDRGS